eukprot:GCRY01004798.1.p1 GENE.GCRY01004798.1~~GCRY01004798.1.p1  ORF type:complete len:240 (+),score=46.37 GCRY01004798.1:62-781(+)
MDAAEPLFTEQFVAENMMGPNALTLLEETLHGLSLERGMRVLDLASGKALTSIYLAKKYDVTVFSVDLWIPPSENFERIKAFHLENQVIPVYSEAKALPFANDYFDAVVCIDSYHYFGNNEQYFDTYLSKCLKKDALIILAMPGLKMECSEIPKPLAPFFPNMDDFETLHSIPWWDTILNKSSSFHLERIFSMKKATKAWNEWLEATNEYAIQDREMMKAENGNYFDMIAAIGRKKETP